MLLFVLGSQQPNVLFVAIATQLSGNQQHIIIFMPNCENSSLLLWVYLASELSCVLWAVHSFRLFDESGCSIGILVIKHCIA